MIRNYSANKSLMNAERSILATGYFRWIAGNSRRFHVSGE